ncbi:hypothetical protein [Glycomyces paridis]|uniref:Uncharacterized protein n=1 Tax=Glycomyces paridis TaxID=2126555 RepID=A0A4V4HNG5_9ACTN|nr:hypothetical protein [Glycomyces paridis]THV25996.1 hypothetical protein E9998_19880 [Glycomyces paridis]
MNDTIAIIIALTVLAVSISAYLRSRYWARRSDRAALSAELAARRAESAAAKSIDALRRQAAALRCYAQISGRDLNHQWEVLNIAEDLDRAANNLDPQGPNMHAASGGAFAKDTDR